MDNIFEQAREFKANLEFLNKIRDFKKNPSNDMNLEIIKLLITSQDVGIIPVSVEGDLIDYKMPPKEKEDIYIEYADKASGLSLKIMDFCKYNGQYNVLYSDYEIAKKSTRNNAMFKDCSYITISGLDLLLLSHAPDMFGIIINPFMPELSLTLHSFNYNGLTGLPKFLDEEDF